MRTVIYSLVCVPRDENWFFLYTQLTVEFISLSLNNPELFLDMYAAAHVYCLTWLTSTVWLHCLTKLRPHHKCTQQFTFTAWMVLFMLGAPKNVYPVDLWIFTLRQWQMARVPASPITSGASWTLENMFYMLMASWEFCLLSANNST